MSDNTRDIASVAERIRPVAVGGSVGGLHFLQRTPVFVRVEDASGLATNDGEPQRCDIHGGAILESVADGKQVITGGDDGKVMSIDAKGKGTLVATDQKRRWIDHVALAQDGAIAWSAGKQAFVRANKAAANEAYKMLEVPSTSGRAPTSRRRFRHGLGS